jgi:hypothetical protein
VASVRATHAAQHAVSFETQDNANPETAPSFADAATATSAALVSIADRPGGKSVLARITKVRFAIGAEPSATLADGALTVTIVPSRGIAGRPSIGQIEQAAQPSDQASSVAAPAAFDVAGRVDVLTVHAEGAQLYQCEPDAGGRLVWTFREPIAALIRDGKTIGRHYAGPTWELDDGGVVKGKLSATAPGASPSDIPLLKLDVSEQRGAGAFAGASLILRLNTHGGALKGACVGAGEFHAEPYSADYVFLR